MVACAGTFEAALVISALVVWLPSPPGREEAKVCTADPACSTKDFRATVTVYWVRPFVATGLLKLALFLRALMRPFSSWSTDVWMELDDDWLPCPEDAPNVLSIPSSGCRDSSEML